MSQKVVFLAHEDERNLTRLRDAADWLGIQHVTASPASLRAGVVSSNIVGRVVEHSWHTTIDSGSEPFRIDEVAGVWSRGVSFGAPPPEGTPERLSYAEWKVYIEFLFSEIPINRWLNSPSAVRDSANRLRQLRLATKLGFRVPRTLVTNDPKQADDFIERHGPCIIKALGDARLADAADRGLTTQLIDRSDQAVIQHVAVCPCLIQQQVKKEVELRVIVVGDSVFAAAIDPNQNDAMAVDSRMWANTTATYYRAQLPEEVEHQVIKMVRALNLVYGALDIIVEPSGELCFLEVNVSGQWSFIEAHTGLPISQTIVRRLVDHG